MSDKDGRSTPTHDDPLAAFSDLSVSSGVGLQSLLYNNSLPLNYAWVAGVIDTKISVRVYKKVGVHVRIRRITRDTAEVLVAVMGGRYVVDRPGYVWFAPVRDIKRALVALLPYLRVRHELVMLALERDAKESSHE